MRLNKEEKVDFKKLRISNFKSFVDPVEVNIGKGLTGVVGPNGCGKSNLVEALRWAMGETSYKSMRTSAMDDVIFSGTENRPPRNFAEVSLVLDNKERNAPKDYNNDEIVEVTSCLLYTSPSPRDATLSRMPSSA